MFPLINQGFDSTLEPSYFSKTYSDKSGGPQLINKTITENGIYNAKQENADGYSTITVDVSGSSSGSAMDVIFQDYDGTILYNYSAQEFANLSAMPANPSHEGLTAQGWNWSLADAKAYVASCGKLNIGQMYDLADGKTRIYITLGDGRLEPYLGLGVDGSVDIDWGDGSEHDTMTGSDTSTVIFESHKYPSAGDYIITLTVEGEIGIQRDDDKGLLLLTANKDEIDFNAIYINAIHRIDFGSGISRIEDSTFFECISLTSVVISSNVEYVGSSAFEGCIALTSVILSEGLTEISYAVFKGCSALTFITIPNSVEYISGYVFNDCVALTLISLSNSITYLGDGLFQNCTSLIFIAIPNHVEEINELFMDCSSLASVIIPGNVYFIGTSAFDNCSALSSLIISDGTTTIHNAAFHNCTALTSVMLSNSVTTLNQAAFEHCTALTSIVLPNSITTLESSAFSSCYSLTSIVLSNNITILNSYLFSECYSLTSLTIPNNITVIKRPFESCYGLGYLKFENITPPTLQYSDSLDIPEDCVIYIPLDSYISYTTAQDYPDPSEFNYVEYATYADGATLPSTSQDETRTYTWYATIEDWLSQTNPISVGNGNEIYCRSAAV